VADVAVTAVNVPQAPVGAQLKVTPAFEESFVTETTIGAVVPRPIAAGGAVENATEMAGGGGGGLELPPPQAVTKAQVKSNDRAGSCRFIESPKEASFYGAVKGQKPRYREYMRKFGSPRSEIVNW
jgi:hypothetical protein